MTQDFNGKFEIYDQNKLEELFSIWSERQRPATVNNNRIIFGVNLAISGWPSVQQTVSDIFTVLQLTKVENPGFADEI